MSLRIQQECSTEVSFPLVVIGGGAAGLVAALTAREAGTDVLVIERDAVPSGSTALSAGLVPAAGTRWQREAGILDDPDRFARDILAKAADEPDPALVQAVTRVSGPTLEWLADRYGFAFSVITDFRYPGHGAHRMHGLASRSGRELMDRLRQAAEAAGVEILTQARAATLIARGDGTVLGVEIERPDGFIEPVGAQALVLACNGYGGNRDLVRAHIPELADALYFGHPGNQGDALRWGEALGAATRHLSGHQGHGSVAHPHGILITWATITEGGVQVNREGRRFSNETAGYSEQAALVAAQPDGLAFNVFDGRIAAIARQFEDFRSAEAAGAILVAPDWEGLAVRMNVPADTFVATMAETEELARQGATDRFGRSFAGKPPLAPPYHAVRVAGALFHTQGGLAVDPASARVVRTDGTMLPNLHAAGGAACGVSGSGASGYLSGNGLLTAVALGRIAGLAASDRVRNAPPPRSVR